MAPVPFPLSTPDKLSATMPEPLPRSGPVRVVETARVPDDVTGEPPTLKPVGIVSATLVTEPVPAAAQEPSPRRNVPLLQVPENVAVMSDATAAVVTYVDAFPFRIPVAGLKYGKVAASATVENVAIATASAMYARRAAGFFGKITSSPIW
jgi:hypothetical protein